MRFEIDVVKRLLNQGAAFTLSTHFTCTDRALLLFGPSGSGKTLTLQSIAGLLTPDEGRIVVNGNVLFDAAEGVNVPTHRRSVGYVFQDFALFPHRTVWENVAFGLKPFFGRMCRHDAFRVDELLDCFGLTALARSLPKALSGGQQQRTALARALAPKPRILLLDEPFSALDQPLRQRLREELVRVLDFFDIPMVMVTHDTEDIIMVAETLVTYCDGKVVDSCRFAREDAEVKQRWAAATIRQMNGGVHANRCDHDTSCTAQRSGGHGFAATGALCP
jgi:molybdate transport system ATP-binding protein